MAGSLLHCTYGVDYGVKPKTYQDLMAGMKAVHSDLAFTVGCGGTAYDALLAEGGRLGLVCDPTVNAGPTRYDEKLCRMSYRLTRDFFDETF